MNLQVADPTTPFFPVLKPVDPKTLHYMLKPKNPKHDSLQKQLQPENPKR